ncbi:hypothetical protein J2X75_003717 [Paenibacillus sp. 2003]|nr:hypothetical protein [Paenibacillus sp. 2003]
MNKNIISSWLNIVGLNMPILISFTRSVRRYSYCNSVVLKCNINFKNQLNPVRVRFDH